MATINSIGTDIPIQVNFGGTQESSFTAYAPVCGGTTSTSPFQSTVSGTSGQALVSNGSAALPTWTTAPASTPNIVLLQTVTVSSSTAIVHLNDSRIPNYKVLLITGTGATLSSILNVEIIIQYDYGTGLITTGYNGGLLRMGTTSTTLTNLSITTGVPVCANDQTNFGSINFQVWAYQPPTSGPGLGADNVKFSGKFIDRNGAGATVRYGFITGKVSSTQTAPAVAFGLTTNNTGAATITGGEFSIYGIVE